MIRFPFEQEKFFSLIALLAERCPSDLDQLKACKLLYFIDREHLLRFGRPITGDTYVRLPYGPVPSRGRDILKSAERENAPTGPIYADKRDLSPTGFPKYKSKTNSDLDQFSKAELDSIDRVLSKYGSLSGTQLIDLSHEHHVWKATEPNLSLDWKLFFVEDGIGNNDAYQALLLEQDDQAFLEDV